MQYPVTRYQMLAAVERYGFTAKNADAILKDLENTGRIESSGSIVHIKNPTDPDAQLLAGLCEGARGGTARAAGNYKVKEYLGWLLANASKHGASVST